MNTDQELLISKRAQEMLLLYNRSPTNVHTHTHTQTDTSKPFSILIAEPGGDFGDDNTTAFSG